MNISIIIPNYNGEKLLSENLPKILTSVKNYTKGKIEIIISDDASSDKSREVAENFIQHIKEKHIHGILVTSNRRIDGGFSKNVNRGVKIAKGDVLVLLNTDVIPHKGFLDPLVKHFEDPKTFAVGCMDESIENEKIILRGRGVGRWERGFLLHSAGDIHKENTLWVSGGSGAFRKSAWEKLGGLNELFNPFYWEDIDLSYRAQKAGYFTYFERKSRVVHEHSKGSIQANFKPYSVQKIVYRNQFIFVWINITDNNLLLNHLLWLPLHLVNAFRSADRAFIVGFFTALMRMPQIIKYKSHMKKLFIYCDRDILQRFSE